jgi:hypothetical protein
LIAIWSEHLLPNWSGTDKNFLLEDVRLWTMTTKIQGQGSKIIPHLKSYLVYTPTEINRNPLHFRLCILSQQLYFLGVRITVDRQTKYTENTAENTP